MLMHGTLRALKFLFIGPLILVVLFLVNWMTYAGDWWVRWAALGIGIAWVVSAFRVMRAAIVLGGLAALMTYLARQRGGNLWSGPRPGRMSGQSPRESLATKIRPAFRTGRSHPPFRSERQHAPFEHEDDSRPAEARPPR